MDTQVTITEPPPAWVDVNTVSTSDTNSTIFGKLTSMVRNVRWLYSKLGTEDFSATGQSTVTGALSSLKSDLDGKSNSSHTHSTGTLPVSSNQVNSSSYIPTSALLYSMAQRVEGIQSIVGAAKRAILGNPNTRYESKNLGTWSSVSDVDTFLSTYTHEDNYEGLSLGNYVTIQDGNYNKEWEIAGFDMESGQMAADGTIYDNGYGICLIPKTYLCYDPWNISDYNSTCGYISSRVHTSVIQNNIVPIIRNNIFGDRLVTRNVLLSSNVNSSGSSDAYTWTTAGATLMSVGQLTGTFASHNTKYDDGEANYKLPLFNYEGYSLTSTIEFYWTRCVKDNALVWCASPYYDDYNGYIGGRGAGGSFGIRPMIYIR